MKWLCHRWVVRQVASEAASRNCTCGGFWRASLARASMCGGSCHILGKPRMEIGRCSTIGSSHRKAKGEPTSSFSPAGRFSHAPTCSACTVMKVASTSYHEASQEIERQLYIPGLTGAQVCMENTQMGGQGRHNECLCKPNSIFLDICDNSDQASSASLLDCRCHPIKREDDGRSLRHAPSATEKGWYNVGPYSEDVHYSHAAHKRTDRILLRKCYLIFSMDISEKTLQLLQEHV